MDNQLFQFSVLLAFGMLFRILFVISTNLGRALKVKAVYIAIDFVTVGVCALIAGFAMIYFAHRVAFFLCLAVAIGFAIADLCIDGLTNLLAYKRKKKHQKTASA